ncbi:MAG: aminotransferase class IV [Gammaproteobacteria bacterium]|nr:aminotransferase class IV [Gammaproteobacteria bacterium]
MFYFNDQFYSHDQKVIDVDERGLLLGDGLFETMRWESDRLINFKAHWQRLVAGIKLLDLKLELTPENCQQIIRELIQRNNLQQAAVRLNVFRGQGGRGLATLTDLTPSLLITANTLTPPKQNITVQLSRHVRCEHSLLTKIKSLNYLTSVLARQEAIHAGFDDGILLNCNGNVVCASAANIFVNINDQLYTPPLSAGALPGTTRDIVIKLCQRLSIPCLQENISPQDLREAKEMFLTNSLVQIQTVTGFEKISFLNNSFAHRINKLI